MPGSKKMNTERPRSTLSQLDNPAWKTVSSPRVLAKKSQGRFWLARLCHVTIPQPKGQVSLTLTTQVGHPQGKRGSVTRQNQRPTNNWSYKYYNSISWLTSFRQYLFPPAKKDEKLSIVYFLPFLLSLTEFCSYGIILSSSTDFVTFNTILSLYFLTYSFWTVSIDHCYEK